MICVMIPYNKRFFVAQRFRVCLLFVVVLQYAPKQRALRWDPSLLTAIVSYRS